MGKYWEVSVGCWVPRWCAITSISLLLNWISLEHVEITEASDSWPQKQESVTQHLCGSTEVRSSPLWAMQSSQLRGTVCRSTQALVFVQLLIAFWKKHACFPRPLQPPLQNLAFCHLHFFSHEHVDEQLTDFSFILSQLHVHRWQYSSMFKKKEIGGGQFLKIWQQNVKHFN